MNTQLFVLCIIFGSMFWIYAMARTGVRKQDHRYNEEEPEIIQELHRGLEKVGGCTQVNKIDRKIKEAA